MARIAGVNIPNHKHTDIALTSIYGVGRNTARQICQAAGVLATAKIKDLNDAEVEKLRDEVAKVLGTALPHLSMGMSDDVDVAVEEGATLVRVGRAIFTPAGRNPEEMS